MLKWYFCIVHLPQKGITVLSTWPRPIRDPGDVADLTVGAKTREKILEIMETGRLERNAVRSADPAWQVLATPPLS